MGDAQPEAVAGVDHTLPADIGDNAPETGATQTANRPRGRKAARKPAAAPCPDTKPDAEPEPEPEPEPELLTDAEPGQEPEPDAEPELLTDAEPGQEPEPDAEPEPELVTDAEPESDTRLEPGQDGTDGTDGTELIEMSEPVELAEPVAERAPRRYWRGLLIGFLFLVAAFAIIGGAFAIVGSLTHGFKKPVIITYKKSAIFSLKKGECIDPNGQQAASIIPCGKAHEAEVFATFTLPAAKWPGEAGVRTAASSGCATRLTGYLNPQLAISLKTTYVYPDKVAWQQGTRKVTCEVQATSGDLTGSVRGAKAS
jgi:hypothetical protein